MHKIIPHSWLPNLKYALYTSAYAHIRTGTNNNCISWWVLSGALCGKLLCQEYSNVADGECCAKHISGWFRNRVPVFFKLKHGRPVENSNQNCFWESKFNRHMFWTNRELIYLWQKSDNWQSCVWNTYGLLTSSTCGTYKS